MTDEQLAALIADDEFGILVVKPKPTPKDSEEERLLSKFQEILSFVEIREGPPSLLSEELSERMLAKRLESLRNNPEHAKTLTRFDPFGLLQPAPQMDKPEGAIPSAAITQPIPSASFIGTPKTTTEPEPLEEPPPASIDELLDDPFFNDLSTEGMEIFDLKHVTKIIEVESPDYVAQRKPCLTFDQFEGAFRKCQGELRAGARKLIEFRNEQQIEAGKFYVLRGILLQVAEIGERIEKKGKYNARLRCIFENGTESDMFLRSLSSELYKDGRRVTELDDSVIKGMVVGADDKQSGFIYVLRSLSTDPKIQSIPDLHKIGLARTTIQGRIKNAANESTYLMAAVQLIASYETYNVNLTKLEALIHRFFDPVNVQLQVMDGSGNIQTPKEWYSVSLPMIRHAVELLISGEITKYHFDPKSMTIQLSPAKS